MLELKNVCKSYNEKEVIKNISCNFEDGQIVSLLGANGSGKTTFLRMVAGLLEQDHGTILYSNQLIDNALIGYLPEERSLFYDCSIEEQVQLICQMNGINDGKDRYQRIRDFMSFNYPSKEKISNLSKGNKQKVAFICCLIKDPQIILLDEPFTGLDEENVEIFEKIIQVLKRRNKLVIVSSHLYQPINQICDRYLYLHSGKIKIDVNEKDLKEDVRKTIVLDEPIELNEPGILDEYSMEGKKYYIIDSKDNCKILIRKLLRNNKVTFHCRDLSIQDYMRGNL